MNGQPMTLTGKMVIIETISVLKWLPTRIDYWGRHF